MLRPLPLSDRTVRIRLLAWSYLDAVEAVGAGGTGDEVVSTGKAGSKEPRRNEALWKQGSYRELERVLAELPAHQRFRFWILYVRASGPFNHHVHVTPVLETVTAAMPDSIYVPADVSQAAGFIESEAKAYGG